MDIVSPAFCYFRERCSEQYVCEQIISVLVGDEWGVWWMGHRITLVLWNPLKPFLPFYIPTSSVRAFSFLHIIGSTCYYLCLLSYECKGASFCSFDLHFPDGCHVEHLFMCLLDICRSPLEKCLFRFFAHLKYWVILSFCYWVVRMIDIFWIPVSYWFLTGEYLFPFCGLTLTFLMVCLQHRGCEFWQSPADLFLSFITWAFCFISKKTLPNLWSPMLYSESFTLGLWSSLN